MEGADQPAGQGGGNLLNRNLSAKMDPRGFHNCAKEEIAREKGFAAMGEKKNGETTGKESRLEKTRETFDPCPKNVVVNEGSQKATENMLKAGQKERTSGGGW